ncbi:hypothetical protein [Pseudoalteromonas marina]|uniref:Uncharacterized protein n=1 Tax=Pseudoalteromonas marina TaxID=267375 RepID=A0ABT9FCR4_9GAMM|nr:hypothetical protein [Pseudoalteromonas marina]MDP2564479.1 hypothetical protein [Pseudoalteromonas marina]
MTLQVTQHSLALENVTSITKIKTILKKDDKRKTDISRTDVWALALHTLTYSDQYDLRLKLNAKYYEQQHVKNTINAISIAYMNGEKVEPISISFIDGKPTVTGGFKRYKAAVIAQAKMKNVLNIPVLDVGNNASDILKKVLTSNNVEQLSSVELGTIYYSLLENGTSEREIANMYSIQVREVKACVATLSAPQEIKEMLINKQISDSQWRSMVSNYGEGKALSIAIDTAQGNAKVTPSNIKKAQGIAKDPNRIGTKELNNQLVTGFKELSSKLKSADINEKGETVLTLNKTDVTMLEKLEELISLSKID